MIRLFVLLLLFFPSYLFAADSTLPVLIVSDNGTYFWMIQGGDGKPVIYEFSQVIRIGKTSAPIPPVASEFGIDTPLRKLLAEMSASGKRDMEAVRKAITDTSTMAASGKFKTLGEVEAVASAMIVAAINDKESWRPVATFIDESLVKLQTSKKIATPADYGRALAEIAKAMQ